MRKIMIVVGHPQSRTVCGVLGQAYQRGAEAAGHDVKLFALSEMKFDPILRRGNREEQPLGPDLQTACDWLAACDHLVLVHRLRRVPRSHANSGWRYGDADVRQSC